MKNTKYEGRHEKDDDLEEQALALAAKASEEEQAPIGAFGVRFAQGGTLEIHPARDSTSAQRQPYTTPGTAATTPLHQDHPHVVAAAVTVDEQEESRRLRDAAEKGRQQVLSTAVNAEIVAPQLFTKESIQMPRFTSDNELRFQTEHNHLFLSALRIVRPVAMGMNLSFFLWDLLVLQHEPNPPLLACFLVIAVSLIAFYALTKIAERNCTQNPKVVQPIIFLGNLLIVAQLSTTMFLLPDGFVIAAGGFGFILIPGAANLRFWYALAFCTGSLLISNAMAIASHLFKAFQQHYELYFVLIHLNMFTVPYCVFGMVLSYVVELHLRLRFRDSGTIFTWANLRQDAAPQEESAWLVPGEGQN